MKFSHAFCLAIFAALNLFAAAPLRAQIERSTIAARQNDFAITEKHANEFAAPNFKTAIAKRAANNLQTSQPFKYERPSAKERAKKFADRAFGLYTLVGVAAGSGAAHWSDEPEEWENDFKGYARRFGNALAENAIEQTVVYGLDEAFKVDSLFYKKGKNTKTSARIANALLTTVTARKPSGRRIVGFSRIAGAYTANLISTTTWYPDRFSYKDGLRQGTISLGFNAAFNLLREFVFPGNRK